MTCKYKNIFGEPGKGLHKLHIGPFAVIDSLITIILAIFFAKILKINFVLTLLWLIIFGEIIHISFGVQTGFLTLLGINVECKSVKTNENY